MRVWRRLGAVVATLALALACAPAAFADDATEYNLWVAGTRVTSANAADVLGDGTVAYDAGVGTLTLTDATIDVTKLTPTEGMDLGSGTTHAGIYFNLDNALTIELAGENSIVFDGKADLMNAQIYGLVGDLGSNNLTVTGEGSLDFDFASIEGYAAEFEEAEGTPVYPIYGPDAPRATTMTLVGIGSFRAIFDGGCHITMEIGDDYTPATAYAACFGGQYFDFRDTTVDAKVGVCVEAGAFACDQTYCSKTADLAFEFLPGSKSVTGFSGARLNLTDDAQAKFMVYSSGTAVSGGGITLTGNSSLTALASNYARDDQGELHVTSYGVAGGSKVVSDSATLVASGSTAALVGDIIDLSGHKTGGAVVSYNSGLAPGATEVWDGETSLVWRDQEPYKYVRVPGTPGATRTAGDYANETAAAISELAFPGGSEYVVIARDDDFADALGATGLAGVLECPIVLTDRMALSEAAAEEIERLGAEKAYIIGGTGAIKDQVDADLKALGVEVEPRVFGENSYDTSLECAKKIAELGGDDERVIVAMSTNFQDALSISPVAYALGCPLILQTWGDTSADRGFTDEAKAFITEGGFAPLIVGGPGAISDASFDGMELEYKPTRIYGETGYDTSNEIANWVIDNKFMSELTGITDRAAVFACGAQAPKGVDALAGAALAGRLGCPILLVNGNEDMEAVDTTTVDGYFTAHAANCKDVFILGGEYVMPQSLVEKIESLLG